MLLKSAFFMVRNHFSICMPLCMSDSFYPVLKYNTFCFTHATRSHHFLLSAHFPITVHSNISPGRKRHPQLPLPYNWTAAKGKARPGSCRNGLLSFLSHCLSDRITVFFFSSFSSAWKCRQLLSVQSQPSLLPELPQAVLPFRSA